jgi:di/tripeptidase
LLDLRSADEAELNALICKVESLIDAARKRAREAGTDVSITSEQVGHRPSGRVSRKEPLVQFAEAALRYAGCDQIAYIAGSTDANIPLSKGIPAVCIGLTVASNAHRLDEFVDLAYLTAGMKQLVLLLLAAAGEGISWNGL